MRNVSLPRLVKVFRRQMPGKIGVAITLGVFTLMFTVMRIIDTGLSGLSEDLLRHDVQHWVETMWHIAPNMVCIGAAGSFAMLQEKPTAFGYLMLPATMQEKFISGILITTVGSMAGLLVGFCLADVLSSLLYYTLLPTVWVSGLPDLWRLLTLQDCYVQGHLEWLGMLDSLSFYLWWHSICVFCAAVFRKNAILYAFIPFFLIFPYVWIRSELANDMAGGLYDNWTLPTAISVGVFSAVLYVAAYRLFPRRILVGHKIFAFL